MDDVASVLSASSFPPLGRPQPDAVEAVHDILLWDAFMQVQNGEMEGVTWADVEAHETLRQAYGPLAECICEQAACVERVRGTIHWEATVAAAKNSKTRWAIIGSLSSSKGPLSRLRRYLCDDDNLGGPTAFAKCMSAAEPSDGADQIMPSSKTAGLHQRISAVGSKWGLDGSLSDQLPQLLAAPPKRLLAILRDMQRAIGRSKQ